MLGRKHWKKWQNADFSCAPFYKAYVTDLPDKKLRRGEGKKKKRKQEN
jgi:hypothetical protein